MARLIDKAAEVARSEGARSVTGLTIRIGGLSDVSESHLRDHFRIAAAGTLLEGARLELEHGPQGEAALADPDARGILLTGVDLEVD
jgi:hydrogenase nickel incorporation protein HypA/HybF